ncbi:MAG: ABC transporter permease [Acidobacteria bacterium]|nr:ABC transporter permease [Acidobacteriota bacterium]MBI3427852.1 ABC transporter permease [Acidobacteriota bacterium]
MTTKEAIGIPTAHESSLGLKKPLLDTFEWFGGIGEFCVQLVRAAATPPFEGRELLRQMDEVGAKSLPLVLLAGSAAGVVMSLHVRDSLVGFGAKSLLPTVIIMSLIKESGPIITALVMSGRMGAGLGAELGSMKVTDQIDAIEVSAVNPYKYLAATRVAACMLMMPLLTIVADFCGIITGWLANTLVEPMSLRLFLNEGFETLDFNDLLPPTAKALVFGLIIGVVGCYQGMHAKGGTAGVGRASTSAVVISSLFVILADVVLVRLIMTFFP